MARSKLTATTTDIITDGGSVLWSIVRGEQLEFPVTLTFIDDVTKPGYIWEAIVVEGLNVAGQRSPPTAVHPAAVATQLVVRIPVVIGKYTATTAYTRENVVTWEGKAYRLFAGVASYPGVPGVDPLWIETTLNIIYLQFPASLAAGWELQPTVADSIYGFFELRVTEPVQNIFSRTWKPVRGMVEILFSPTEQTV
jgi:hypothetical protein